MDRLGEINTDIQARLEGLLMIDQIRSVSLLQVKSGKVTGIGSPRSM